ncbi:MAG TPA: hypothetical protein VH088_18010 [Terriglobales bacterium]|nr:hypothetical protein [Terriglobales bacterium]
MSLLPDYKNTAAEWEAAQQIHAIYTSLAREFTLEVSPSQVLEAGGEMTDEKLDSARQWLSRMDDRIEVHQLRQYLQNTQAAHKEGVLVLLEHFLRKADQRPSDRDKVDFLLVQHFFNNAPSLIKDGTVELKYVAEILKPVIGPVSVTAPEWLKPLDVHIEKAVSCKSLNELFQSGALESARKLKTSSEHNYFDPTALVAFTRFNFLIRRIFFRLLHQDINGILDGLRELEQRGVQVLDCRRAEFSAEEPILRLRMICQSWKVMFQAEYSLGQPLRLLTELRSAVDVALDQKEPAETQAEKSEDKTVSADDSQDKGQSKKSRRARAAAAASATAAHNNRGKDTEPNADKSRHDHSKRK